MIDFQLKLMYFAKDREWRLYDASGAYRAFSNIDYISDAVRAMLRTEALSFTELSTERVVPKDVP